MSCDELMHRVHRGLAGNEHRGWPGVPPAGLLQEDIEVIARALSTYRSGYESTHETTDGKLAHLMKLEEMFSPIARDEV